MLRIGLVVLVLAAAAQSQQTVPGTFNTVPPQEVVPSDLPVVSTPTLTLSNGFSPALVTLPQSIVFEQPGSLGNGLPQNEGVDEAATASTAEANRSHPDYGTASSVSAYNGASAGPGLGEIARSSGKARIEAHKTYTNEDIDRLTWQEPESGVVWAKFSNGQPIVDRNQNGFSPMSGIANMPEVLTIHQEDPSVLARQNSADDGNGSATASNTDQGHASNPNPTTPSLDNTGNPQENSTGQLPASDNPH